MARLSDTNMNVPKDIEELRGHLYARAEGFWWVTLWISLGTQVFSLLAVWLDKTGFLAVVALLALLALIAIAWLREKANGTALRADKCRRLILYADGLGRPLTKEELAEVRAWAIGTTVTPVAFVLPYYSSTMPVGPNRLADIVAESSFFTSQLAERVISIMWAVFIASLCVLLSILFLSDLFAASDRSGVVVSIENLAKSAALVITFLISGDFLLLIKKYADLRSLASNTFQHCGSLRDQKLLSESDILAVVEDYHIGLSQAPPIPARLYKRYRDELNKVYRESHEA